MLNPDGSLMTFISHGQLTDEQEAVVRIFVAGRNVHDIGAGQLALAQKLVELGAHTVTAVDRIYSHCTVTCPPQVTLVGEYFEEYAKHGHLVDVAFLSWPEAYQQQGVVQLIDEARVVIYLGNNFDGVSCGSEEMFQHLVQREVLALVPHKFNSLIVYGSTRVVRRQLPEEFAALHREMTGYFTYGEDIARLQ